MNSTNQSKPQTIIVPRKGLLSLNLAEVWKYRDLLMMNVKRDFVTFYKQTILGPIWFIVQPILTTLIYMLVFGNFAGISTDGVPQPLFYLTGITIWNYFSECFSKVAVVFKENQNMFGKVYFPRLIAPLSVVISGLLKFGVQFLLLIFVITFHWIYTGSDWRINNFVALVPFLILLMAMISLGLGMIISSLTVKYRDLTFLLQFAIQLLMYATPIIYPLSSVPEQYQYILNLNPLTHIIEAFKYGFLGSGVVSWTHLFYSFVFCLLSLFIGTLIFNKTERTFMDTI